MPLEEEAIATKADQLEDGLKMMGVITLVTVSTHSHVHNETQKAKPCCIQSVFRRDRDVLLGESYGNLLKAGSAGTLETIDVDFTGTDLADTATEFHMERSIAKQANSLRYRFGDDDYYLAVDTEKEGQVKLCRSVNVPTDDKYYFHIKRIGPEYEAPFTFKTLKTNKYLHCNNDGKVFMKEATTHANGIHEDRQTWFRCMRSPQIQEQFVRYEKLDVTFTQNKSGIECLQNTTVVETKTNSESTSPEEGNSKDAPKQNSEDPEAGNSEDSENEKCDGPGREDSKDPEGEVTREDLKEGHPGESENRNLEIMSKDNDPGRGNSKDPEGEVTCEDLKKGHPGESEDRNLEIMSKDNDPGRGNSKDPESEVTREYLKEGHSRELKNRNLEILSKNIDPGRGNYKYPEVEVIREDLKEGHSGELKNRNLEILSKNIDPGRGNSKDTEGEVTREDLKEGHPGESKNWNLEILSKDNDPGRGNSKDTEGEMIREDLKEEHSGESENRNLTVPSKENSSDLVGTANSHEKNTSE